MTKRKDIKKKELPEVKGHANVFKNMDPNRGKNFNVLLFYLLIFYNQNSCDCATRQVCFIYDNDIFVYYKPVFKH